MSPIIKTARFIKEFATNPRSTGAIAPSGPRLSKRMLSGITFTDDDVVVEYGPGTGSFTKYILPDLAEGSRFFAVEITPGFCKIFRKNFPGVKLYEESVVNIRNICDQEGVEQVDYVISGLPWAAFSCMLQTEILEAMMTVLKPGGRFVTFAYLHGLVLPSAKKFRNKLEDYFSEVNISKPVWANLPPAICYTCVR
ncbi:MAG: methyltransferase [Planctomycetes bacterium]|nr:methyltransferase [Planctomycetota bacterium]